ncbi:MAG: ATP-binding protein [Janthinobacterium lividum]
MSHSEAEQRVQDGLSAQVAILDSNGDVTAGSAAWRDFLETSPLADSAAAGIQAVLTGAIPLFLLEYSIPAPDAEHWYNLRVTRFPGGGPVQIVALQEDVTARKQAEESLRQRVEELADAAQTLEQRNAELDQFAYITSHDLKAPLRGIANLSRWIEEDLEGSIPPEVAGQFDLMRGRVNRMEAMIEAILQYSRIDRTEVPSETVDVKVLLTEVIDLLNPPTSIAISMDDQMPILQTPRLRLYQVFQNLLSNAIKHHDKPTGRIHVGAQMHGEWVEFSVKDDGPGIAPKFQERIWVIFQTLQARDKVENTGVGLALVKKIVEAQGGAVSVEAEEGQGAAFKFTWPST